MRCAEYYHGLTTHYHGTTEAAHSAIANTLIIFQLIHIVIRYNDLIVSHLDMVRIIELSQHNSQLLFLTLFLHHLRGIMVVEAVHEDGLEDCKADGNCE